MMLEELQRRHYSGSTTRRYIRFIERFAKHFHCSPDRLGPQHIREYQAQLFTVRKLTPGREHNLGKTSAGGARRHDARGNRGDGAKGVHRSERVVSKENLSLFVRALRSSRPPFLENLIETSRTPGRRPDRLSSAFQISESHGVLRRCGDGSPPETSGILHRASCADASALPTKVRYVFCSDCSRSSAWQDIPTSSRILSSRNAPESPAGSRRRYPSHALGNRRRDGM